MSENLREQTFRAMKAAWRDRAMSVSFDVTWRAMTDAAWSVVGPELDRLNARVYEAVSESQILRPRASIAEAERDVLRARLAKVERLADEADDLRSRGWPGLIGPSDLRAALASVPEPSDSGCEHMGWGMPVVQRCVKCGEVIPGEPSDSKPAPDADREAGEWDGDDLPTPDEAERMGWTV